MGNIGIKTKYRYTILLALTCLWYCSIFVPPLAYRTAVLDKKSGGMSILFFSHICHQQKCRSFTISGVQLAVCSRCTGIYSGFLAGVLLFPVMANAAVNRRKKILMYGAALLGLEFVMSHTGVLYSSNIVRFCTGLVPGFIVAQLCAAAVLQFTKSKEFSHG